MFTLRIDYHFYSASWAEFYPALVAKGPYLGRGRGADGGGSRCARNPGSVEGVHRT